MPVFLTILESRTAPAAEGARVAIRARGTPFPWMEEPSLGEELGS